MLTKFVFAICFILVSSGIVFADEIAPVKVDLYPSGALLTFEMQAKPDIQVELPSTINIDSISVFSGENVSIQTTSVRTEPRANWIPPALATQSDELDKIEKNYRELDAKMASLQEAQRQLASLKTERLTLEQYKEYIQMITNEGNELAVKIAETKTELDAVARKRDLLKARLESLMPDNKDSVLVFSAKTSGTGIVKLIAWTDSAAWAPRYRLDLESKSGKILGRIDAWLWQKTGVTWDSEIILHSAAPVRNLQPPTLNPAIVDFVPDLEGYGGGPQYRKEAKEPNTTMVQTFADTTTGMLKAALPQQIETLSDVTFTVRQQANGYGEPVVFGINEFSLQSEVSLVAVPRISGKGWIIAKIDKLDRSFLPADAELNIDSIPTGKTFIPEMGAGQKMELAFGTTHLVKTEMENFIPVQDSGWWKGQKVEGYKIKLTNGLSEEKTIKVIDRIPVSAQEKISLEMQELDPDFTKKDDNGIVTWEMKLAPGETKDITVRYLISFPSDKSIYYR